MNRLLLGLTTARTRNVVSNENLLSNPNLVAHFTSKENLDRLTRHLIETGQVKADNDNSDEDDIKYWKTVFFHMFTPERGVGNPAKIFAHNMTVQVLFDAGRFTTLTDSHFK